MQHIHACIAISGGAVQQEASDVVTEVQQYSNDAISRANGVFGRARTDANGMPVPE